MGEQFGAFLYALYGMYYEAGGDKRYFNTGNVKFEREGEFIKARFRWDSEGHLTFFALKRRFGDYSPPDCSLEDMMEITIDRKDTFTVDARDLCYAVAKASTDAMKNTDFTDIILPAEQTATDTGTAST